MGNSPASVAICFFFAFAVFIASIIVILKLAIALFQSIHHPTLEIPNFYTQVKDLMLVEPNSRIYS